MKNFWQTLKQSKKAFTVLAPMDGVTDFTFREILATTAKPDVTFTEFTNVDALFSRGYDKTITRLKLSENQKYAVAQIWGKEPENFRKASKMIAELGFDGIDINMGCPDKNVMKLKSGCYLIGDPTFAAEVIQAVKEGAGEIPVSVKTRLGNKKIEIEPWAEFLLKQNISALTIHARTAKELSKVEPHWDEVVKVVALKNKLAPETVLIGNGDITNLTQAAELCETIGLDGVMIGRGVFANPWVFEGPIHDVKDNLNLLLKHTKLYVQENPNPRSFDAIKKFFKIYVKNFHGAVGLKADLMACANYEEVEGVVSRFVELYNI